MPFIGKQSTSNSQITNYTTTVGSGGETNFTVVIEGGDETHVYLNGVLLKETTDYTVSSTQVSLVSPAVENDIVEIKVFRSFALVDAVRATGGTFSGDVTVPNLTLSSNVIKASDGGSTITLDTSDNVTIAGGGTFGGTVDLQGNELILDADNDTSITADTDDQIDFRAGGADSVKIGNEHLTINDGNLVIGTSGHGITFPDTDSSNDSSTANEAYTLDSYEEGSWTPTNAGDNSGTLVNPSGLYVKVGRIVVVTAVGVVGDAFTDQFIGGLPFTPSAYGSYTDKARALAGSSRAIKLNSSTSNIRFNDVNGTNTSVTSFRFTITYITD